MKRKGASMIFINDDKKVLLFLRDDSPIIPFPNMWDVPGGHVEENETPAECIVREMKEEMNITMDRINFFKSFDFPDREEYIFWKHQNLHIPSIHLTEGQMLQWFSREEAKATELACGFNEVLEAFFSIFSTNLFPE